MNNKLRQRARFLALAVGAALVLEFAGCKGETGGSATTEPGAAGTETNSAATNAPSTNAPSQ